MTDPPAAPPEALRRARVFWEQSGEDLKAAKRKQRAGGYLEAGYLSLQAAVNALSAVCTLSGQFQLPASDLGGLLTLCKASDPAFGELEGACQALEEAARLNPFVGDPPPDGGKAFGKNCLKDCAAITKGVRSYLKANRKHYFAP